MKHMVHKGQVFFYSDDSNTMYLLDTKTADGKEVVEADVDESFVSTIVWKDKNGEFHPSQIAKK